MGNENRSNKCQSCGSSELETENGYKVCTDCGHVNGDSIQLDDDPMQVLITNNGQMFTNQTVINSVRNELVSSSKATAVQQMGIQTAETLALNYSFNSEMKNYLMDWYTKGLDHKNFFKQSLKNKRILAAVCAYITLMNHNESIAIQYVCSAVDCSGFEFGQMLNLFVNTFPECKPKAKPIEELVPSVLADFHMNEEEVSPLRQRVIDIISIEKACWLVDGRSPLHLITAATYLGWKSLQPIKRAAIDFNEFCKTFGIEYKRTSISRIKELNDAFIKLAQLIPWVKFLQKKIHKNNVAFFIDDIIQYPNSLIFDLRKDVYQQLNRKQSHSDEEDSHWMNSFKRKANSDKYGPQKKIKECQLKTTEKDERQEPTDISDTEINGYLRTQNEIKIIKKLRKRAKRMNNESQL